MGWFTGQAVVFPTPTTKAPQPAAAAVAVAETEAVGYLTILG